jgi:hypothetical protein
MKNIFKLESGHIYITSDEEIKNGDWCINIGRLNETIIFPDKIIGKADYTANVLKGSNWRKIILTTDPDLIKDNIQSIDDIFLEWFVKNPSCERVEVDTYSKKIGVETDTNGYREMDVFGKDYRIIIPQEQPKINLEKLPFHELIEELSNYYKDTFLVEEKNPIQLFSEEFILGFLEYIEGTYSYSNIFDHWYLHADTSKSFSRKELLKEYQKTILPPNKLDT